MPENSVIHVAVALIVVRWLVQLWIGWLNHRHVQKHAGAVPQAFQDYIDPATYQKSVHYTLAKSRFHEWELAWSTLLLGLLLATGVLPRTYKAFTATFGTSAWAGAAYLFVLGAVMALLSVPFDWYSQFRLEERFGFNTTTVRTWIVDRLKGAALALILGYPLIVLVLKLVDWTGQWWWLWAWAAMMAFQLLMVLIAPVLIMPLFNKFTPLAEGSLDARLKALAERTGFRAKSIQVMDGSKRSRHSNAFFTGFGRFRKIVFFDTLIEQLQEPELEAVLAHEIGHYKKRHIHKGLAWSALISLATFYVLARLAATEWFYRGFGFQPGEMAPAFLIFALLAGTVSFWLTPFANYWSRRFEYQADAFAADAVGENDSLISALRKLNEKNLSNLTPHPIYSGFYYSHPTLLERENALRRAATVKRQAEPAAASALP